MSMEIVLVPATDEQILYMREHPSTVSNYVEGQSPVRQSPLKRWLGVLPPPPPAPWPDRRPRMDNTEVNVRAVRECHFILNGTHDPAEGARRIFETGFRPDRCKDLEVEKHAYALNAAGARELLDAVRSLTPALILDRARTVFPEVSDDEDLEPYVTSFQIIEESCRRAAEEGRGLLILPS